MAVETPCVEKKKGGVSPDGHGQKKNRRVEEFQGQSTEKKPKDEK